MALGITISTNMTVDVNLRVPVQRATEPALSYNSLKINEFDNLLKHNVLINIFLCKNHH